MPRLTGRSLVAGGVELGRYRAGVGAPARDIGEGDRAIVAQYLQREQPVEQAGSCRPAREERGRGGVEHDEIGLLPRLEHSEGPFAPRRAEIGRRLLARAAS